MNAPGLRRDEPRLAEPEKCVAYYDRDDHLQHEHQGKAVLFQMERLQELENDADREEMRQIEAVGEHADDREPTNRRKPQQDLLVRMAQPNEERGSDAGPKLEQ